MPDQTKPASDKKQDSVSTSPPITPVTGSVTPPLSASPTTPVKPASSTDTTAKTSAPVSSPMSPPINPPSPVTPPGQNLQSPVTPPGQSLPPIPDTTQGQNVDVPPVVSVHGGKKGNFFKKIGKKKIATALVVLLLVVGVTTGVFLVQQQQDIREKAYTQKRDDNIVCHKGDANQFQLLVSTSEEQECKKLNYEQCTAGTSEKNKLETYTTIYTVKNETNKDHKILFDKVWAFCPNEECGKLQADGGIGCGDNSGSKTNIEKTVPAKGKVDIKVSVTSPFGACGSYQTDFVIRKIDDSTDCAYVRKGGFVASGVCQTGKKCPEQPTCNHATAIKINNCTKDDYNVTPRKEECITEDPKVTLTLNVPGANNMRFINMKNTSKGCAEVNDENSRWSEKKPYNTTKSWDLNKTLDDPVEGEAKVCGQFYFGGGKKDECGTKIFVKEPAGPVADCRKVKAYTVSGAVTDPANWTELSADDLSALSAGDEIYLTVKGYSTYTGTNIGFDEAKITVNGTERPAVKTTKPKATGEAATIIEFYDVYEITEDEASFDIKGTIHHTELGWL